MHVRAIKKAVCINAPQKMEKELSSSNWLQNDVSPSNQRTTFNRQLYRSWAMHETLRFRFKTDSMEASSAPEKAIRCPRGWWEWMVPSSW